MERIIVVPDVHGRTFWRKVLDNTEDKIIFLDYSDPYEYEGISHANALSELEDIIKFKKENMDRVILLLGNHDWHYINNIYKCSRFSAKYFTQYNELLLGNLPLFTIAYGNDGFLFTHAGVTQYWANHHNIGIEDTETIAAQLNYLFQNDPNKFFEVGYSRGGWNKTGSPLWADISEHSVLPQWLPKGDYVQVFGHSQQTDNPASTDDGSLICLDCRKVWVLENDILNEY